MHLEFNYFYLFLAHRGTFGKVRRDFEWPRQKNWDISWTPVSCKIIALEALFQHFEQIIICDLDFGPIKKTLALAGIDKKGFEVIGIKNIVCILRFFPSSFLKNKNKSIWSEIYVRQYLSSLIFSVASDAFK